MTSSTEKEIIIRDSVYGNIIVDDPVAIDIINTYEFQRLRNISQLSNIQLAFPSATHTRFSHCLGVYHLIKKVTENKLFSDFYKNDSKKLLITRIAGLVHDIGHGPFSHTFEITYKLAKSNYTHENYSKNIINSENSNINKILIKHGFTKKEIDLMCEMIEGKCKQEKVLSSLVSSQLDMDRLDYLLRDGYHTGVKYSNVDVQFIISNFKISEEKEMVYFPEKVIFSITSFLLARFFMHIQIYSHHINTGFDLLFQSWFKRVLKLFNENYKFKNEKEFKLIEPFLNKELIPVDKYVEMNDFILLNIIKNFTNEEDEILSYLSKCFFNRTIFRNNQEEKDLDAYRKKIEKKFGLDALEYFLIKYEIKNKIIYNKSDKPILFSKDGKKFKTLDEYVNFDGFIEYKNFKLNNIYYTIDIN